MQSPIFLALPHTLTLLIVPFGSVMVPGDAAAPDRVPEFVRVSHVVPAGAVNVTTSALRCVAVVVVGMKLVLVAPFSTLAFVTVASVVTASVPAPVTVNEQSVPTACVHGRPVAVAVFTATVKLPVPSAHATCAPVPTAAVSSAVFGCVELFLTYWMRAGSTRRPSVVMRATPAGTVQIVPAGFS